MISQAVTEQQMNGNRRFLPFTPGFQHYVDVIPELYSCYRPAAAGVCISVSVAIS